MYENTMPVERLFLPIVESCHGCDKTVDSKIYEGQQRCTAYIDPSIHWRNGHSCPLATYVHSGVSEKAEGKVRVGQQKQRRKR